MGSSAPLHPLSNRQTKQGSVIDVSGKCFCRTTLDDVFVHYTGRQLRDEQVKAPPHHARPGPGAAAMNRMLAIGGTGAAEVLPLARP